MAASLETVILKLLQNTTNEGQVQGFREIQDLFKDPSIIISLCQCLTQSQDPHVREYAALLLRRRLLKVKFWKKVPDDVKQGLKQTVLESYIKDNEKRVRNAIAELVAAISKHEFSDGKWPELMTLLNQSIRSNNVNDREVGLYTMSVIAKTLGAKLKPHFKGLLSLFQKTLTDTSTVEIPFYTIKALTNMVCSIGTEEMNLFQALIPNVITVIKLIANDNQVKACECLEIFDELVESEVAVLAPHLKSLIDLCLEIAASNAYGDELRIKAVNIVAYLIRLKKKAVIKQRLAQPILEVIFPLMCNPGPGDDDDDSDLEEQTLPSAAGQALDVMALHLPPSKLLPLLMHHLQGAFENADPYHRKAAYLAISVIAEGCSEFIRYKYLPIFVPVIIRGIQDNDTVVRNAALYAVGQYAEYLQPEISKYASELLPVLFDYLQATCQQLQQGNKNPPTLMRTFYAVERFCENLEDILPYLPTLMNCLTTFLTVDTEKSAIVKELAVEAIGSVAAAAKSNFLPYFQPIMSHLQRFIAEKHTDETRPLQIQSIDTLAIIARTVGPEIFMPLAHDCIKCGIHLMTEIDDPDVRRSCYGLFSSVSVVLKSEMAPYLNTIVERMLESVKSLEGISISTSCGDRNTAFTLFEDEDDEEKENGDMNDDNIENLEDAEDEDDDDVTGYNVENAYVEEKEGACLALKEMSDEVGAPFLNYIEVSFNEVKKLIEHLSDDVRRAAVGTLGQFCITLNDIFTETGNLECRVALETNLGILLPKLFSLAREDTENTVVLACLETLQNIIDKIKGNALNASYLESICLLIKDVFKNKLACQDEDTNEDEDEQEAEYDNLLLEYAGELIASLIKVVPWNQFAPYLAGLMPFLLSKSKKACTVSEKSFSIGTLADIVSSMQPGSVRPFLNHLQPVFLSGMKEENEEVRSNAVYGLGVLAQNAGDIVFDQYPLYLQALSNMIASEEDPRAKDNICGAVARLIQTNINGVPLNNVFPVFLNSLPLKEDLEENATVFECLNYLYSIRCEQFFQNIPQILKVCSESAVGDKLNEKAVALMRTLLNSIYNEFPNDFESVLKTLPQANAEALAKARLGA
ncbi:importin-4-like [Argiope bruennichi]|uniref:importin-4-like n=1 Tax=Argiope bruennichi TaxID=94029 RepID=UPI002495355B|nr:importin-4-like [Argiope bruennichi]